MSSEEVFVEVNGHEISAEEITAPAADEAVKDQRPKEPVTHDADGTSVDLEVGVPESQVEATKEETHETLPKEQVIDGHDVDPGVDIQEPQLQTPVADDTDGLRRGSETKDSPPSVAPKPKRASS